MGVAPLTKVTVISPRAEYEEVVKHLAEFEDFDPAEVASEGFDPRIQELTVRAVQLFARADQAVKDLALPLMPGQMDIVFRGAKITKSTFEAGSWDELLNKAEMQAAPILEEVRTRRELLQRVHKEEADSENLVNTLKVVSDFSADLSYLSTTHMFKVVLTVVEDERVAEFKNAVPDAFFVSQPISKGRALVLTAVKKSDEGRLEKAVKLLELKPLVLPPDMPQNPAEAFKQATKSNEAANAERLRLDSEMEEIRSRDGSTVLAVRELAEAARIALDQARVSGSMKRMAVISGYIPAKKEAMMRLTFGRWIVRSEEVKPGDQDAPTLFHNVPGPSTFELITREQGFPGRFEVDPTPIVAFVFPVFFGMMFGDVGHGLILTAFMLFVRWRSTGNMRRWADLFIVSGVSAVIFGVIFGEFFERSFQSFVPIPPIIEIIHRVAGSPDTFSIPGLYRVMEIAILVGILHLITALSINIYEGVRANDRLELLIEKIPLLTMYIGGVMYGIAFIGVGFSFDVLKSSIPAPLFGIPNNLLGEISLVLLLPSMLVLLFGKSVAVATGKAEGESTLGALANGALEVFERISQFLSNTISYVRLAVMLLVHAALLLIINMMQPWANPLYIAPWVVLNLLILAFEAFIVYVQDLRLHLYEFFTKFYLGGGTPFRKIIPDRAHVKINWH